MLRCLLALRAPDEACGAPLEAPSPGARLAHAARRHSMGQLITEAAEGDDEFWGQDAWKEVRAVGLACVLRPFTPLRGAGRGGRGVRV